MTVNGLAVKGNSYICKVQETSTICNKQSTKWMVSFFSLSGPLFHLKLDIFSKGMRKNGIFKNWRFHM